MFEELLMSGSLVFLLLKAEQSFSLDMDQAGNVEITPFF